MNCKNARRTIALALAVCVCLGGGSAIAGIEQIPAYMLRRLQAREQSAAQKQVVSELMEISAFDGYALQGKLSLPANNKRVPKLVIFVNGSGPNTVDNFRRLELGEGKIKEFNYFDLYAEQFAAQDTAFFRYNTRGVTPGAQPPLFADVDEEAYQTYLPQNTVQDVEAIVRALKLDARLAGAKVILLGWSEGTMIAPQVAQRKNVQIDGLLLAGYCNDQMETVLSWQQGGGSTMVFLCQYFDTDKSGTVSKEEYEKDPNGVQSALGAAFGDLDVNKDGEIAAADIGVLNAPNKKALFDAIERNDDSWLKQNYDVRLTSAWFKAHREFAPNKQVLPTLDLPIHIFHGTADANTPVEVVGQIARDFHKLGKTNLTTHIFAGADHDLNYLEYILHDTVPEGIQAIFDVCKGL